MGNKNIIRVACLSVTKVYIYKIKIVKVFNIKPNATCELVELSEYCVSRIVKTIRM